MIYSSAVLYSIFHLFSVAAIFATVFYNVHTWVIHPLVLHIFIFETETGNVCSSIHSFLLHYYTINGYTLMNNIVEIVSNASIEIDRLFIMYYYDTVHYKVFCN